MVKCAHTYDLSPIDITVDTADRIYRGDAAHELLCVALHGDYKYGYLRNTVTELDSQNDTFVGALSHELAKRSLIILGYSGRDKSLMTALSKAYEAKGTVVYIGAGMGKTRTLLLQNLLTRSMPTADRRFISLLMDSTIRYIALRGIVKTTIRHSWQELTL
jgi:hypothetical protein